MREQARKSITSSLYGYQVTFFDLYWVPEMYQHRISDIKSKTYQLSVLQRIFLTFEFPNTSPISDIISYLNAVVILISVISIIISSLQHFTYQPSSCEQPACDHDPVLCPSTVICAPEALPVFGNIDLGCVAFFTVDFVVRLSLCSIMPTRLSGTISEQWDEDQQERSLHESIETQDEPYYSTIEQLLRYVFSFYTAIDLISIIPSYIALNGGKKSTRSLSSLRILRLLRVLRVMRITVRGRMIVNLLSRTMKASQEAFAILLFYLGLIVIFFASVIYAVESGEYTINSNYPDGEFLRPDGFGGTTDTPFSSIPTTMYYMIVTLTTVGYGDMSPTTIAGRAIASVCCILGILSTALPISIISNNFTLEYQRYLQKKGEIEVLAKAKRRRLRSLRSKRRLQRQSVMTASSNLWKSKGTIFNPNDNDETLHDDVNDNDEDAHDVQDIVVENIYDRDDDYEEAYHENQYTSPSREKDNLIELKTFDDTPIHRPHDTPSSSTKRRSHLRSRSTTCQSPADHILAMSDQSINSLDHENLQVLFHELRGAYRQLHSHNVEVSRMTADLEMIVARLNQTSIFQPVIDPIDY